VRVTETKPLTKEDLVAYLASGCKPRSDWRWRDLLASTGHSVPINTLFPNRRFSSRLMILNIEYIPFFYINLSIFHVQFIFYVKYLW
jgi:hypothetical protein